MDSTTHTSAHSPHPVPPIGGGCAAQLAFYGINDPLWLPTLLKLLAEGGCVVVERTGDLLFMPAPNQGG